MKKGYFSYKIIIINFLISVLTFSVYFDVHGACADHINVPKSAEWIDRENTVIELDDCSEDLATGAINLALKVEADFSFEWKLEGDDDFTSTDQNLSNLQAGTYIVIVKNEDCTGGDCTDMAVFEVGFKKTEAVLVDVAITRPTCRNSTDGAIDITVSETESLAWQWNGGTSTSEDLTNRRGGIDYNLTLTDQYGCTLDTSIRLPRPSAISPNFSVVPIPCKENGLGVLSVSPSGGTGSAYSVIWQSDNQMGDTAKYESPGTYEVVITDENECSTTKEVNLGLAFPPGITEFPEQAVFTEHVPQSLSYETDSTGVELIWEIAQVNNIDTNLGSFNESGQSEASITLSFGLLDEMTEGSLLLFVRPKGGLCIGESVETMIEVRPSGCPIASQIFSPNNGEWSVSFPSNNPDDYELRVFSRGGQEVFRAAPMNESAWNASGCPDGDYYYIIRDRINDQVCRGVVTVLR